MKVEQIYTGCLAQGAYYIESNGEAAIIDPLREVEPYIKLAKERKAKIKYVFETHFHADFVSGHIDLADKTGADIVYGPTSMKTTYNIIVGKDGQEFKLGNSKIRLIHTPGHTMESSCYLLIDENGKETSLFTGDTLFIGDVGRPDLAQKVIAELTQEKLAGHLYDSLRNKIMPLPDDIIVYPGHGAGSACGKMMSDETTDTLGHQKKTNYALREDMGKEDFIDAILTGLTPPPGYFPQNVMLNIQGYESIDEVIKKGTKPLSVDEFELLWKEKSAVIIDTREAQVFAKEYIPDSYNIGIDGSFANWVGTTIVDVKKPILIVAEKDREEEVATRLARIGFDNTLGYLKGGIDAWKKAGKKTSTIPTIEVKELAHKMIDTDVHILDVRRASEYNSEHIEGAINAPLDYLNDSMTKIDKSNTYYVHCRSGYRSMVFVSILKSLGYNNLIDIKGGLKAIKELGKFKLSDYREPTTML
ncbi:glyoxylase-like metal-dependent hydrolase (beta-lactamase superfamily II) [Maribacter caenipelagi]|uniref:Glyoxylase-like metal-dependent hydrolase (Beta-lactamase superfamily II) n=1 Tax=Maribacter caenipelagi TaxID=1447781 RepID=A0A4R7DCF5_9FLAO|nr:MBL fold metallo-hydrolase [Maribacter caenipelagi]TDS16826.1 glyoxylase-like metal-dependent hydrolase (beta-lactamase superfamily II) [Maribacter caenipelagi]